MEKWKSVFLAVVLGGLLATANFAIADPSEVHLTSYYDYEVANAQGRIVGVSSWGESEALEGLHPGMGDNFRPPVLYILGELLDERGNFDSHPGVLMAWGNERDKGEIISAWDLILPVDPDLTNMCITLTAWPRQGMTSISFSVKDINGNMKGWSWPVGAGGLPMNAATTVTISLSGGAGQAGSTGFWDGGVDLTQIVSLEFDESGNAQGGIPLPNNLGGFVGQWNYWHDIIIFPCPCPGVTHPNNGFGNGSGDGIPGNSAGKGANGRFGPIDDTNR